MLAKKEVRMIFRWFPYAVVQVGVTWIAAVLWRDLRREERRRRLLLNLKSVLNDEQLCPTDEKYFTRAA